MYTVIWIDNSGNDRWDRFDSKEEVSELLDKEDLRYEDTWIFGPEADDYATTGYMFGHYPYDDEDSDDNDENDNEDDDNENSNNNNTNNPEIKVGDIVRLNNNYYVSDEDKRKQFIVLSEPYDVCGTKVVKITEKGPYAYDGLTVVQTEPKVKD
jgi:hypothetical protein